MLAEQFDAFLLDLDGVVYIGAELLPGAAEALGRLREAGKAIRFLTNDPRPTRSELAERLAGLGVEARADEVITCGWATAEFLRREGVRSVFVVGSAGLRAELEQAGIAVVDRERPEAVVVGADEHLGYLDILRASRLIHQGARFVAVNVDGAFPVPGGLAPATGAVVSAVQAATGRRPIVVGKPSLPMFELALASLPGRQRVVMVGDTPESDVLGAHQAGIPAILVAEEPPRYPTAGDFRNPDACIRTLLDLFEPGRSIRQWTRPSHPWPERVAPGVAAVVLDGDGRVLLVKRADNGRWGLPMGQVERGETVAEAVARELREEVGLEVRVLRLVGVYSEPASQVFVYPSGEAVQFVTCCLLCEISGGALRADDAEILDAAFFPPDALPDDLLSMHPRWLADALAGQTAAFVR
ncbi:HAD-IIA family hydrolase [Thermalbibacter longus]|nr:HAD-IIA family hydrolase [Thermalbibacter longus]